MSLRVKETLQLTEAQKRLNEELIKKFGPCLAEHDDDYIFHMTFAIAYEAMKELDYKKKYTFRKLGLLYYDNDNYKLGTYFCYKICNIG